MAEACFRAFGCWGLRSWEGFWGDTGFWSFRGLGFRVSEVPGFWAFFFLGGGGGGVGELGIGCFTDSVPTCDPVLPVGGGS